MQTFPTPAAEVVKRHIAGLHQTTSISSVSVTDSYEPQEEGLDPVNVTRYASVIDIQLSKEVGFGCIGPGVALAALVP